MKLEWRDKTLEPLIEYTVTLFCPNLIEWGRQKAIIPNRAISQKWTCCREIGNSQPH